jgi:hypothetical protein
MNSDLEKEDYSVGIFSFDTPVEVPLKYFSHIKPGKFKSLYFTGVKVKEIG